VFPALFLQQQSSAQALVFYGEIALMILVVYFIVFRPIQRQKKQQQEMLGQLKAGDNVVTSGGIVGTITSVDTETIVLRVKPDNLKLQFSRSAVSAVVPTEGAK
jgi:preprotein translocase subunit YajC